jgi:beta-1,4-mannosyltransferase
MNVLFGPELELEGGQRLLASELRKLGMSVTGFRSVRGLLVAAVRHRARVVQLRRLVPLYSARSRPIMILRLTCLAAQLLFMRILHIRIVWRIVERDAPLGVDSRVVRLGNTLVARLADLVIVPGPGSRVMLEDILGHHCSHLRIEAIPEPDRADVRARKGFLGRAEARAALGFEDHDIVFLYLGPLVPGLGLIELVATFRNLRLKQTRLLLTGPTEGGDIIEELRLVIAEDDYVVHIHPGELVEVTRLAAAADFAVILDERSLVPESLLTALSLGIPPIAPAIGSITDYVDCETAVLYDPSDPNGLTEALAASFSLLGDATLMGERASLAAAMRDVDGVARRTIEVFDALVAG